MASLDAETVRAELERLKSKYRKEALRAVAAAEKEGYERGRKDENDALKNSVSAWKMVAEAVQSNGSEGSKPIVLIQHVVEQVYRDIKNAHNDSESITASDIKAVLRLTAQRLSKGLMGRLVLENSDGKASTGADHVPSAQSSRDVVSAEQRYAEIVQPPLRWALLVNSPCPTHCVTVQITAATDNVVKGVFLDGQFISYELRVDACDVMACAAGSRAVTRCTVETRASEVKALHQRLVREHSYAMLPAVPARNYKIQALAHSPTRPKKLERKAQYRRRLYARWLQYAANLPYLRDSPDLQRLLGLEATSSCGTAPQQVSAEVTAVRSAKGVTEMQIVCGAFLADRVRDPAERRLVERVSGFLAGNLTAAARRGTDRHDTLERAGVSPDHGSVQLFDLLSAGWRDLRLVDRDVQRALPLSLAAVASCRAVVERWCDYSCELRCLGEELAKWRTLEPPDSVESALLGAVTDTYDLVNRNEESVGAALHTHILEPLEFLHEDCLQAAKDSVEATLRRHPTSCFVPAHPAFSIGGQSSIGTEKGDGDESSAKSVRRAQEAVEAAVQAAVSWDGACRVRGAMTVQALLQAASHLADLHATSRAAWEKMRDTLVSISIAGTSEGEGPGGEDRSERASLTAVPALSEVTHTLREAIGRELAGIAQPPPSLEEAGSTVPHHDSHNASVLPGVGEGGEAPRATTPAVDDCAAEGNPGASATAAAPTSTPGTAVASNKPASLAKTLGSLAGLKSMKALFQRAAVPSGRRRSPSVSKPADLPPPIREEDLLAAQYNERAAASDNPHPGDEFEDSGGREVSRSQHDAEQLLQQDQRQHRLAARRHAAAHSATHVTSKIRPNTAAVAQAPAVEVFGAAPAPAEALHTHSVLSHVHHEAQDATQPQPAGHVFSPYSANKIPVPAPASANPQAHPPTSDAAHKAGSVRRKEQQAEGSLGRVARSTERAGASSATSHTTAATSTGDAGAAVPAMPSGWVEVKMEDGGVYYYHTVTRVSRWDRPAEDVAAALEARIQQTNAQVDEAVQRHKEERARERQLQEERDAQAEKLQAKVRAAVEVWAYGRVLGNSSQPKTQNSAGPATRDVVLLLTSLHTLVPYIPGPEAVLNGSNLPQPLSSATCPPAEVKKGYMRAVRFVHPDKLPDDISLETRMVAEAAFILLTEAFNRYRASAAADGSR